MAKVAAIVAGMRNAPQNVRYSDLAKVCVSYFGVPRQEGTSHAVYKTPWAGDPRVNIQAGSNGMAKVYQVRQVLKAIDRLTATTESENDSQSSDSDGTDPK